MTIKMKQYNATLRHAGEIHHEILLSEVTDKEVRLLRDIHGSDAVVNIREVGEVERDERQEFFRLVEKYGSREDMGAVERMRKRVEKLFNVELDGFDDWLQHKIDQSEQERASKRALAKAEMATIDAEAKVRAEIEMRMRIEAELRAKIEAETLERLTAPAASQTG